MKHHRELSSHGHRRSLLGVLATAGGYLLSMASEVRVGAKRTQDVVGAAHQELPEHLVALLGDALLRILVSRLVAGGHQPQVCPYRATPLEAVGIFQGEHEGECGKRPYPYDLAQELGFWVMLFRDGFQLALVVADALGKRADLLQDGT